MEVYKVAVSVCCSMPAAVFHKGAVRLLVHGHGRAADGAVWERRRFGRTWTDSYDIYDENGNAKYFVKAEFFAFGHQLHVYDWNENEIAVIYERLFTFLLVFELETGGRIAGSIKKQFSFLVPKYENDYNGWCVEGDFPNIFLQGHTPVHMG